MKLLKNLENNISRPVGLAAAGARKAGLVDRPPVSHVVCNLVNQAFRASRFQLSDSLRVLLLHRIPRPLLVNVRCRQQFQAAR